MVQSVQHLACRGPLIIKNTYVHETADNRQKAPSVVEVGLGLVCNRLVDLNVGEGKAAELGYRLIYAILADEFAVEYWL